MSKRNVRFEKVYVLDLWPLLPQPVTGTARQWAEYIVGTILVGSALAVTCGVWWLLLG